MLPVLLIVHFLFRSCLLCADLIILFLLYRRHVRQNLLGRPHQTSRRRVSQNASIAIMILKLSLDVAVLIMFILSSHTFGTTFNKAPVTIPKELSLTGASYAVAIGVCFRLSMTCVSTLEASPREHGPFVPSNISIVLITVARVPERNKRMVHLFLAQIRSFSSFNPYYHKIYPPDKVCSRIDKPEEAD